MGVWEKIEGEAERATEKEKAGSKRRCGLCGGEKGREMKETGAEMENRATDV